MSRRLLFGALAGAAVPRGFQLQVVYRALDFEYQALLRTGGRDDPVPRLGAALGLQAFLQARLRVLVHRIRIELRQCGAECALDDFARDGVAAIQEYGAIDRFKRVGKDRRSIRAS